MAKRIDIEDVIFDGIVAATGLAEDQVVWKDQPKDGKESAPQPTGTYIAMKKISGLRKIGLDDEQRSPRAGSEKQTVSVLGQREFTLSVQSYRDAEGGLIQDVLDYFQRPSVGGALGRRQSDVVEVATVTPSVDYVITIGDETVSIDSGLTPTAETIRDALVLAVDALDKVTATAETEVDRLKIEVVRSGEDVPLTLDSKLAFISRQTAVDLVYMRDTGETNLTEFLDGISFEDRAATDIFMNTKSLKEDDVSFIDTVEGAGTVDDVVTPFTVEA